MHRMLMIVGMLVLAACGSHSVIETKPAVSAQKVLVVCPQETAAAGCDFSGTDAIQAAVDSAQSGSTIHIKPGVYRPQAYRDIPFQKLMIRGFTVIENKDLTLRGEGEVILDGSLGAASAFVTKNSWVSFSNIQLNDFRWGIQEDDTYDGHGIFVIGGKVSIEDVAMRKIQKMGLTVRDAAQVEVTNLRITESHLGVWTNETSVVNISNSLFQGSESCGLGAYDNSRVTIANSIFDGNLSDGIYASDQAFVTVSNTTVVNNKPVGVSADEQGQIQIDRSFVSGNGKAFSDAQVSIGSAMLTVDPRTSAN